MGCVAVNARNFTGLVLLGAFVVGISCANTVSVTAGIESAAIDKKTVKNSEDRSRDKVIAYDGGFNLNAGSPKLEKSKEVKTKKTASLASKGSKDNEEHYIFTSESKEGTSKSGNVGKTIVATAAGATLLTTGGVIAAQTLNSEKEDNYDSIGTTYENSINAPGQSSNKDYCKPSDVGSKTQENASGFLSWCKNNLGWCVAIAVIIITIIVTVIVVVYIKCFSLKHLKSEISGRCFSLGISSGGYVDEDYLENVRSLLKVCDKQSLGGLSLLLDVVEEAKGSAAGNFVQMLISLKDARDGIIILSNIFAGFAQLFKTKDSSGDTLFDAEAAQGFVRLISSENEGTEENFLHFLTRGLAHIIGGVSESGEKVFNEVAAKGFISLLKVDNAIFVGNFANFLNKFSQGGCFDSNRRNEFHCSKKCQYHLYGATKPYICVERVAKILSNGTELKKFVEKLSDEKFDVFVFLNKLRVVDGFSFDTLFQKLDISSNLEKNNNSDDLDDLTL